MPIDIDPSLTRPIRLAIYPHRAADQQPVIHSFVPRKRASARLSVLIDRLQKMDPGSDLDQAERVIAELTDAVRDLVAGWDGLEDERGRPVPFSPDALEDALTDADISELAAEMYALGLLGTREKKASASPSRLDGATATTSTPRSTSSAPAATAPAAAANATATSAGAA